MHISMNCAQCGADEKSKKRDFSDQAWTVLVLWNEVQKGVVDKPICEECYAELREVLIDRADEVDTAVAKQTAKPKKSAARARKAS